MFLIQQYNLMKQQEQFLQLNKNKKIINKLFMNKENTVDKDGVENDVEFSERIIFLKEKRQMTEQHIFAKRADFTDDQYQMIQKIGDLHYMCQLANDSSSQNIQKWPKEKKCICGCKRAAGESLPYCTDEEESTFFGPGVILFFFYSKRILIMIIFAALFYGVYSVVTNAVGNQFGHDCQTSPNGLPFLCEWIRAACIKNKGEKSLVMVQVWLAIPICFFWAVGIRLIRNMGRRLNKKIDDKLDSSSDYCIWIEDLPSGKYNESDLVKYLAKLWRIRKKKNKNNPRLVIRSIQLIYNMSEMQAIINKMAQVGQKIFQMYENPQKQGKLDQEKKEGEIKLKIKDGMIDQYQELKKQLDELQTQFKQFRKKFIEDSDFRKKISHEAAIIQCEYEQNCDELLDNYGRFQQSKFRELKNYILSCCVTPDQSQTFMGVNPKFIRAPQPSDINWVNAAKDENLLRVLAVWGINLLLIGASFGSLMLFRYLSQISETLKSAAFIKIIILNLFNRLIWNILNNVISIEENKTKSEQIASVMNKSYLGQSCNVIVLPMIMNLVFADNLYGPNGLSGAVHDYQITVFFFMLLFNLINIPHRITQLLVLIPCTRRMLIKYFCRITDQFDSLEQIKQALAFLYEPPKLPLAGFYVYIMTTTNQAFFFCHLQPVLLIYLLGNLILFYLVNKFLLFKQCKIPDLIDFFIFETMIVMAMNVPLFYAIGSTTLLILGGQTEFVYYLPGIFCFLIWFLCSQNPFNIFSKLIRCLQNCYFKNSQPIEGDNQQNIQQQTAQKLNQESKMQNEEEKDDVVSIRTNIRRQNYYAGSPMTALFNFQNKMLNLTGPYQDKFKLFCQGFQFNVQKKKRNKIIVEDI